MKLIQKICKSRNCENTFKVMNCDKQAYCSKNCKIINGDKDDTKDDKRRKFNPASGVKK